MASTSSVFAEEDFVCPVCRDVFEEPVVLGCGHSFCRDCVQECWRSKDVKKCPMCSTIHSSGPAARNLALKSLCEAFVAERQSKRRRTSSGSEDVCSRRAEGDNVFCLECLELACGACFQSDKHSGHTFSTVEEAAPRLKEEVRQALASLKDKLKVFCEVRRGYSLTKQHISVQGSTTLNHIKEQFQTFRRVLADEQEARIATLLAEEGQKTQRIVEIIEDLDRDIESLSDAIRASEYELGAVEDMPFLQNYNDTVQRLHITLHVCILY